jgi:hypothetical protein
VANRKRLLKIKKAIFHKVSESDVSLRAIVKQFKSYAAGDIFVHVPPKQTLKAWEPFFECVGILFDFQASEINDEHPEWRTSWVAGLALLRTIGHVLVKVDSLTSKKHAETIKAAWESWKRDKKENWILWDFIEQERNNILKTYKFGVEIDSEGLVHKHSGLDGVQLFREAVYWWCYQLEELESKN